MAGQAVVRGCCAVSEIAEMLGNRVPLFFVAAAPSTAVNAEEAKSVGRIGQENINEVAFVII